VVNFKGLNELASEYDTTRHDTDTQQQDDTTPQRKATRHPQDKTTSHTTRQRRQQDTRHDTHPITTRHATTTDGAAEVASLRAEVAALRADLASLRSQGASLVAQLVGALDALRAAVASPHTTPPHDTTHPTAEGAGVVEAQGEGVEGAGVEAAPSTTPAKPVKGRGSRSSRGSRGDAEGLVDLQRLVSLVAEKQGERGKIKAAALLIGNITGDGVGKALKAGRVTPDLAARVRAALVRFDAEEG
jgi:hypothetical protein